jgi:tetratricopeptide (TPR) repeat protein
VLVLIPVIFGAMQVEQERPGAPRQRVGKLLDEAAKAILDDEASQLQIQLVSRVAGLEAQIGDLKQARALLLQVRRLIETQPKQIQARMLRHQLARNYAVLGDVEEARRILDGLPDTQFDARRQRPAYDDQDMARHDIAFALAGVGKIKEALEMAKEIKANRQAGDNVDPQYRPENVRNYLLADAALYHAREGDFKEAWRILEQVQDAKVKARALSGQLFAHAMFPGEANRNGIALIQDRSGDRAGAQRSLRQAVKIAAEIKAATEQEDRLAAIASAQARVGDVTEANKTLEQVPRASRFYEYALAAIAEAQAKAGQDNVALEIVGKLSTVSGRAYAYYLMGIEQARSSNRKGAGVSFKKSFELAQTLPEREQDTALYFLAAAQAKANDFQGAVETAKYTANANAYVAIAREQARAGDIKGAQQTVEQHLRQVSWQGSILSDIARNQVERGGEKAALAWVRELTPSAVRGQAMLGMAEGLVQRYKIRAERP